jgi:hypothetical protein
MESVAARTKLLSDQRIHSDQIVYQRAHNRGEITLDHIPPAVLAMPFDLVRHPPPPLCPHPAEPGLLRP